MDSAGEFLIILGALLRAARDDPEGALAAALARAGPACGADRAQVCRCIPGGGCATLHAWTRPGAAQAPPGRLLLPPDVCAATLSRGFEAMIPAAAQGAPGPARRLVAAPLSGQTGLAGCLVLAWEKPVPPVPGATLDAVRALAETMGAVLERTDGARRAAETASRVGEDRALIDTLLSTSAAAIFAFDADRRIVFANAEAAEILGATAESLPGHTIEEADCLILNAEGEPIRGDDLPSARVLASGQPIRGETLILAAADGRQRIFSVNAAPVPATGETAARVVLALEDVTGQVSADSALRTALAEAHQLAFFDPLTGQYNRRGIVELLRDCIQTCARDGTHLALLYIDVDGMRQVNGSRGHWMGDRLLQAVAVRLDGLTPPGGELGRISADEFVITFAEPVAEAATAVAEAEAQAEAVLAALREPFRLDETTVEITVSVGLAAISAGDTVEGLLKGVDLAVMAAKAAGGNRAVAYRPDMERDMLGRAVLAQDLRVALRRDEFRIHFEPMLRLGDGGLVVMGHEALIRWQHPLRGLVPPQVFIPFAEETGFVREIDLWVLRAAATEQARWADNPERRHLRLSVNISSAQFLSPGFGGVVRDILSDTGADPARIEFEVTEGTLLSNLQAARATMLDLRALGLSIALDDFGTGFSSLSYLRDLPVDVLKIDRSFLSGLQEPRVNMTIVEGIIGLARGLGVEMVAEGVETPAQFEWLASRGCRRFQGYLFGRPGPEPQVTLPREVAALGLLAATS